MHYTTLISVDNLWKNLNDPNWVIIDCRFSLNDTEKGRRDYLLSHIPGAVYAHLDADLCAPIVPGKTGRHPLPSIDQFVRRFSEWGIDNHVQVVAYDDWAVVSGAIAARLWWSLRWLGHTAVAVLDGGWFHWQAAGLPVSSGVERRSARTFTHSIRPELLATADEVDRVRQDPAYRVIDSRSADRYRGENETIDPIAGHIPGAIVSAYVENVGEGGLFLPVDQLNKRFRRLIEGVKAENTIFYCGSGVTAAHNMLAMAHAGLGDGRLYVGSWSDWITDPTRPVSSGRG